MGNFDIRFDTYIDKAAPFAQPVLIHLRQLIHQAVPEVTEGLKWGHPHFDYKGPFVSMAAFKQHLGFNFWKASLMDDPDGVFVRGEEKHSAGNLGQISSLADLPPDDVLIAYLKNAAALNDAGKKVAPKKPAGTPKAELVFPEDLMEALAQAGALDNFEKMSYTNKKEYLDWLTEAKTDATHQKRLQTTVEQVKEGKSRHWKYH
ncbi:uncharacterized protein YdeI (YjbR/CyaY-like superfamily) [Mucilaginibacter yixingensis]|uniref:Uncharacterized protein YdeI (YjbR/CyaY-like superfamily) n=1 Tax=Mucilaginibacter yixingensis TaxID=1295612 RepID=A0A2T5J7L2_9SPHI|nr:DUF1801 domain-containing protein [Mucilaginibacter yixingensis]PTQ95099.1 uncharacterized protein YdeI (YjbR/CyaY-like superfamily) [Mucilaginibacter yixingensis]